MKLIHLIKMILFGLDLVSNSKKYQFGDKQLFDVRVTSFLL
jgi:hypothetical protein